MFVVVAWHTTDNKQQSVEVSRQWYAAKRQDQRKQYQTNEANLNKDKGLSVFFITDFLKNEAGQNISKRKQWTGLCREAARQDYFILAFFRHDYVMKP